MDTVSTSASPRLQFDIGSVPVRPLPSRFSIKNDDALDEVGVWFSVSFPCMFSRFHGAFTPKPSGSCLNCALRQKKVQAVISSVAAFELRPDEESSQRRDGDLLGASGRRGRQGDGNSSTVKRQVKRSGSRGHPAIGRAQWQMGFSKERAMTVSLRQRACVCV